MEVITYSRNVFIPITNACRNRCSYCGFRSSETYFLSPEQVRELLIEAGKSSGASEALFTFGERPEVIREIDFSLKKLGYQNFIDYVADMNKLAISMGYLPHTNAGVLEKEEMEKLKPLNASMGLMLEQAVELDCHSNSPGKKPEKRIETIRRAGKLSIPFTTGLLIGIGEKSGDRVYSLEVIKELHEAYGHIQEVIIQNFEPKPRTEMEFSTPPTLEELLEVVKTARETLPDDITIQIPPNLVGLGNLRPFIEAGVRDLGGINEIDYINPEHIFPRVSELEKALNGYILKERLPIYPGYIRREWYSDILAGLIGKLSDKEGFRC